MATAGKFSWCDFKPAELLRANGMKVFVLFAAAMSLAGCELPFGKPNVYKMPVARAYHKLMNVDITPSGKGPFGRLDIATTGERNKLVEWTVKGSPQYLCAASVKPQDAEQTLVAISCNARGDGAESGIAAKMMRKRVIELVDATLKDRPFDPKKASEGTTAAFWPDDVIDHGNFGTAAAKALEMDRQMAETLQEVRSSSSRNSYGRR
jgi:hypothetical protein